MTVFLVRHADAKSRANWPHADETRPLTKRGVAQADGLVELLHAHPITRVLSSPYVRCIDTVKPLADKLGVKIEKSHDLEEGADPSATYDLLRQVAREDGAIVLCTHGDVVPEVLRIASRDGLVLADTPRWPKGSTWAIEGDGKRFKRAKFLPPPEG